MVTGGLGSRSQGVPNADGKVLAMPCLEHRSLPNPRVLFSLVFSAVRLLPLSSDHLQPPVASAARPQGLLKG